MHKRERFKAFIVIFVLSVLYILVFSESGILERRDLRKKNEKLNEQIESLKQQNYKISKDSEKYLSGIFNGSDLVNSGFIDRSGKFIFIDEKGKETIPAKDNVAEDFTVSTGHLRIIWIIISIMYITYYFMKNNKSEESADGSDFNRL